MKTHKFVLMWLIVFTMIVAGCGSTTSTAPATPTSASTTKLVLGNNLVTSVTVATQSGTFYHPLDSTPDLMGTTIYFTASGPHGPGVFRVPAGGGTATELFVGKPFVAPRGIALSVNGQQLYVADPAAGQIFLLPIDGGSQSTVPGSLGTAPQNLDVLIQGGQQVIYFTGKDPGSGLVAVFELPATGAKVPMVLVKGSPLVAPDGVTVTHARIIYIADRSAASGGFGKVFKIVGSTVTVIVDRVRTGNPAGIALSANDAVLLVSALQPNGLSDQVLLVDLSTLQTGSVTKVIAQNQNAGGLHASRCVEKAEKLAWADGRVGGNGKVYLIELK